MVWIFAYCAVNFVVRVLFKNMIQFKYFSLIYMIVFLQKWNLYIHKSTFKIPSA